MPAGKYESIWMSEHAQVFYDPRCNSNTFHGFILPWSIKLWQHQHALRGRFLWSHCFLQSLASPASLFLWPRQPGKPGFFGAVIDAVTEKPSPEEFVREHLGVWKRHMTYTPIMAVLPGKTQISFWGSYCIWRRTIWDCFGKTCQILNMYSSSYVFLVYSLCIRMYDMRICMCIYIIYIYNFYIHILYI